MAQVGLQAWTQVAFAPAVYPLSEALLGACSAAQLSAGAALPVWNVVDPLPVPPGEQHSQAGSPVVSPQGW